MSRMSGGPFLDRRAGGDRIGRQAPVAAAMRRDEDAEARRVDEMEGDVAGGGELLGPGADPPEMAGIADGGEGEAEFAGALGGERHRLAADHLAVAEAAVEEQGRAAVVDDRKMPVGEDLPGLHPVRRTS